MTSTKTNLFIVGVGRSGTSLLQSIMASHSDMQFLPETALLRWCLSNRQYVRQSLEQGERERLANKICSATQVSRLSVPVHEVVDSLVLPDGVDPGIAVYAQVTQHETEKNCQIVGDKDPRLIEHIGTLIRNFECARIIVTRRDPRDVLRSKKKADWSKGGNSFRHVVVANIQNRMSSLELRKQDGNILVIGYEDLITGFDKVVRRICTWLDVEYQAEMEEFQGAARKLVSSDELQWKKETFEPLKSENFGKWREDLSPFEIGLVERGNAALMRAGEYQPWEKKMQILERMAYNFGWILGVLANVTAAIYVSAKGKR